MRPECKTIHAIELLYINLLTKPFPEHIGKLKGGAGGGGVVEPEVSPYRQAIYHREARRFLFHRGQLIRFLP